MHKKVPPRSILSLCRVIVLMIMVLYIIYMWWDVLIKIWIPLSVWLQLQAPMLIKFHQTYRAPSSLQHGKNSIPFFGGVKLDLPPPPPLPFCSPLNPIHWQLFTNWNGRFNQVLCCIWDSRIMWLKMFLYAVLRHWKAVLPVTASIMTLISFMCI